MDDQQEWRSSETGNIHSKRPVIKRKPDEDGCSGDRTENSICGSIYKKAKFAWQVKGEKKFRGETDGESGPSSHLPEVPGDSGSDDIECVQCGHYSSNEIQGRPLPNPSDDGAIGAFQKNAETVYKKGNPSYECHVDQVIPTAKLSVQPRFDAEAVQSVSESESVIHKSRTAAVQENHMLHDSNPSVSTFLFQNYIQQLQGSHPLPTSSSSPSSISTAATLEQGAGPARPTDSKREDEQWQSRHTAKAIVDNAINKTLENMGFPDVGTEVAERYVLEDAGISAAICRRGLVTRNSLGENRDHSVPRSATNLTSQSDGSSVECDFSADFEDNKRTENEIQNEDQADVDIPESSSSHDLVDLGLDPTANVLDLAVTMAISSEGLTVQQQCL